MTFIARSFNLGIVDLGTYWVQEFSANDAQNALPLLAVKRVVVSPSFLHHWLHTLVALTGSLKL